MKLPTCLSQVHSTTSNPPLKIRFLTLYKPEPSSHFPPTQNISHPLIPLSAPTQHFGSLIPHSNFNEATYLPLTSSFHHLQSPTKNQILTLYKPESSSHFPPTQNISHPLIPLSAPTQHFGNLIPHSNFNEATYLPLTSSFHHLQSPTKNQILTLYKPEPSSHFPPTQNISHPPDTTLGPDTTFWEPHTTLKFQ